MGLELAKAYIRVQADASRLDSDFSDIRATTDKHLAGVKASALGVLGIFSGGMAGILRSGLASAGQFEQTTIAFETMLGSAEETEQTLARLTEFAAKTPFEMPEITQAARGLIQFGERGDQLMGTLRMLGDAASGTSTPFSFLALVFNQVRGVGKLLTQDFRQLSTRGILSMQDIADHFGTTLAGAEKKISSGKVSFEDLRKIMEKLSKPGGRFANMMEKQSKSLVGLASTLNDAWSILFRTLATSLMPAAKSFTTVTIKMVETLQALVNVTNGGAAAALAGATAVGLLGTALLTAGFAAKFFGISLRGALIGTGIGVVLVLLGAAAGVLVDKFGLIEKVAAGVSGALDWIATSALDLWEWIKAFGMNWEKIWNALPDIIEVTFLYIGDIITNAVPLFAQTLGYGMRKLVDVLITAGKGMLAIWGKIWTSAPEIMTAALTKGGIGVLKVIARTSKAVQGSADEFKKGLAGEAPDWTDVFAPSTQTLKKMGKSKKIGDLLESVKRDKTAMEEARKAKTGPGKPTPTAPTTAKSVLEQGRYQLPELSNKIQDTFLKKDDGLKLDKDRNGLLESGLKKQDDIIKAIKDSGGGAAVLTGGDN